MDIKEKQIIVDNKATTPGKRLYITCTVCGNQNCHITIQRHQVLTDLVVWCDRCEAAESYVV